MLFRFSEGEMIALKESYPNLELNVGNTGVIWGIYNTAPPSYEVTFEGRDGRKFDMTMDEDELMAVPSLP